MTPLMQQYWEIKNQHPDKILLFRMGDFFEMFHQDAETAAPLLGIALTVRNRKANDETKMCGVPYHSIAGPIAKLLAAGHKVAICDQIEDPATAKGLVKRAVTRVLSPGMVYDPQTLDALSGHFISSYDSETVSFLEPTTGDAFYYRCTEPEMRKRLWQLLQPSELVLTAEQRSHFEDLNLERLHLTVVNDEAPRSDLPRSAERLLNYARTMQGEDLLKTVRPFIEKPISETMDLSPTALRHLEILVSYRGERQGTLLSAMDRTKTAAGTRLLKSWLQFPLKKLDLIERRQTLVQFWVDHLDSLKMIRQMLSSVGDIERRLSKIASNTANARDLVALAQSARAGLNLLPICPAEVGDDEMIHAIDKLLTKLETEFVDEPPLAIKQGGMFKSGHHAALDELIRLSEQGQNLLQEMETSEKEKTGISSLKIRFNNVFGYYLEVTNTHSAKVPSHYQRKQTLANAERYITEELQKLEAKLLSAHAKRSELEFQLFQNRRSDVIALGAEFLLLARRLAELDVITSLSWLAIEQRYVKPQLGSAGITLKASRHPVVEQSLGGSFTANDVILENGQSLLLTGPNMAGKSTLMRQVAVIAVMAQVGSFVPASEAQLPLLDAIFTRIGASDYLSEGLSTFMVEMTETAAIVQATTAKSLVILDEIGRGTSTFDGLSLAQAILEYLVGGPRGFVLFATHYHELSQLSSRYPHLLNGHMAIHERAGEIQFLHTLMKGPANKSYGIQVAKKAGLPQPIIQRAKALLNQLEFSGSTAQSQLSLAPLEEAPETAPAALAEYENLKNQIRELALQKMTPLEALNQIAKWQQSLS